MGWKEASSIKLENTWNENILSVKHKLKTDQTQTDQIRWIPYERSVSLEILNVVRLTAEMRTPLHMLSNVLFIQEKLSLVNQTWREEEEPVVMSALEQKVCFWTFLKGLFVELYNPAQTSDYFSFSVRLQRAASLDGAQCCFWCCRPDQLT